jgi:hypothetical protein
MHPMLFMEECCFTMPHKNHTLIDEANSEDSLGSITGFLCLQILSHIDAELSLL